MKAHLTLREMRYDHIMPKSNAPTNFPPWIWKRLAEQGYTGIAIPEEYGGSGGDFLMAALVARAIGRANSGISMSFGAHLNLCRAQHPA